MIYTRFREDLFFDNGSLLKYPGKEEIQRFRSVHQDADSPGLMPTADFVCKIFKSQVGIPGRLFLLEASNIIW